MARRIVRTIEMATPAEMAAGVGWYDDARAFCKAEAKSTGYSLETVAGIVSVLSPMTEWELNKKRAATILTGVDNVGLNSGKAVAIRDGGDPWEIVTGRKVSAFFRAILGDETAVVIDRHAHDVAVGKRSSDAERKVLERKGQYALFVEAYERAAMMADASPIATQAVAWVVFRNRESKFAKARNLQLELASAG